MERLRVLDDGAAREAYWQLQLPETCACFAPHLPEVQQQQQIVANRDHSGFPLY